MRKFLGFLGILVIIVAAVAASLFFTTPKEGRGVGFPLTRDEMTLLSYVPSSADSFAILPTAAATYAKLHANPVARGPIEEWTSKHSMPWPWMLGAADLVAWKADGRTSYAIRLDPLRATLVRAYLMISGDSESSPSFRINAAAEQPMSADELSGIVGLAGGLPAGDILVVQRERGRGAFPPMARPAVSSIAIAADHIEIVSRAASDDGDAAPGSGKTGQAATQQENERAPLAQTGSTPLQQVTPKFARAALMSMWFAAPPRAVDDLNRLFGARVSSLVADGGQIVLYQVETGKLLPRPRGVFVVPADDVRRDAVHHLQSLAPTEVREALGFRIDTAERGTELIVAFDDTSVPQYLKDAFDGASWPANRWAARIDAQRFVPVLEQLDGSRGLRIVAPRLYRSARDLGHWIAALREARSIEAADSVGGAAEELRVRIDAK